jgi:hypothetical protein
MTAALPQRGTQQIRKPITAALSISRVLSAIHPLSVSITPNPDMGTKITDVLSVKVRRKRRHYRWVGFKEGSGQREGYIQEMYENGQLLNCKEFHIEVF